MSENFKCPRCGKMSNQFPALSRADNKTNICSACGTEEALQNMTMTKRDFLGMAIVWLQEAKLTRAVNIVKKRLKEECK